MGIWRTSKLIEVAASKRWALNGGPFGSKLTTKHYSESGVPVIRGTNLSGDTRFSFENFVWVSEEKADELLPNNAHPGDLVFTQRGTIGQVGLIPLDAPHQRFVISQSQMKLTPDPGRVDALFLYYFFSSPDTVKSIENLAFAAGVPHINLDILRNFEVPLPPLPSQRRIARILSAYDELIENSQRRIKILESMARGLYREWFVHFRFPSHESVPLVPSPLGEVPQGWEVQKLGKIADISWGDTSTTKAAYAEEGYAAYSASGLDGKLDHYDFDRLGIVLSAIGAKCGKTWLARGKWSCIKNTIRFWSKSECVSTEFLFVATLGQDFWPRRGAAQPFISQGDAERIDILVPDVVTMKYFTIFYSASLQHIATLDKQIQTLRRTRDLLLPRLLSGQIDVEALPEPSAEGQNSCSV